MPRQGGDRGKPRKGRNDVGKKRGHYDNSRREALAKAREMAEPPVTVNPLAPRDRTCPACHTVKLRSAGWVAHKTKPGVIVCGAACALRKVYNTWIAGICSLPNGKRIAVYGKIEERSGARMLRLTNGLLVEPSFKRRVSNG